MSEETDELGGDGLAQLDSGPEQENEAPPAAEPAADAEASVEEPTELAEEPVAKPEPQPIGPRWFAVHTGSQPAPVNLLLRSATTDGDANVAAVKERFLFGHGITHTPHEIAVRELPADYVPTGADLDHHEAIETALAKRAAG